MSFIVVGPEIYTVPRHLLQLDMKFSQVCALFLSQLKHELAYCNTLARRSADLVIKTRDVYFNIWKLKYN